MTKWILTVLGCCGLALVGGCSAYHDHEVPPAGTVGGGLTPDAPSSCAAVLCPVGTTCAEIEGEAMCLDENPCNLVDCMPGAVCEVVDDEAVCVSPPDGEPGGPAPFCGGIAALPCPGAGECQDDPSDGCDPETGGADCGGVCTCDDGPLVLCAEGTVFDSNPEVCGCVAIEPELDPCATVRCAAGTHCEAVGDEAHCVSDGRHCRHGRRKR